jgi:hypothetical protein
MGMNIYQYSKTNRILEAGYIPELVGSGILADVYEEDWNIGRGL